MKFAGPVVILLFVLLGGIAAWVWAADQFTPPKWSLAEIADFPNLAARKYVVLEMLKRFDAAGGDLTLDKLKQIVHEPLVRNYYEKEGWVLETQNPNLGWQVSSNEKLDKIGITWEQNKCAIKIADIRNTLGPLKVFQANTIPETDNPPMIIYKKMWGHIWLLLEQDHPGHGTDFVTAASITRDTLTPEARRARLVRAGDWSQGKVKWPEKDLKKD